MAFGDRPIIHAERAYNYVWDVNTLSWLPEAQPSTTGGAGGGGAVTVADGADVTQGATTDAAIVSDISGTLSAKIRGLVKIFASVWDSLNGRLKVDGSGVIQPVSGTLAVTGTFWQTTQPISGSVSVSNFPGTQPVSGTITANAGTGPVTAWKVDGSGVTQPVSGSVSVSNFPGTQTVSGSVSVSNFPASQPVTGTFWQATQPVSAASLPLPSGAATAAKQPALGVAGTPSTDVISVQGVTSMTPLKVDGSGVTQPVSGTVTANAGTGPATAWKVDLSTTGANATAIKTDGSAVTQPVSGTVTVQQATAANLNATVTQQTLTKGTQGSTGVSVQDLKDAGRTPVVLYLDSLSGITTEALATMNINKGGTVTTGTSYTVTTGKTLRITSLVHDCVVPSTTGCASRLRLRAAGTVAVSSPIYLHSAVGTSATAFAGFSEDVSIPDGLEFAAGTQIGLSHIESSTIAGSTTTGAGVHACVIGFEY